MNTIENKRKREELKHSITNQVIELFDENIIENYSSYFTKINQNEYLELTIYDNIDINKKIMSKLTDDFFVYDTHIYTFYKISSRNVNITSYDGSTAHSEFKIILIKRR